MKRRSVMGAAGAMLASLALATSVLAAGFGNGSFETGNYVRFSADYDFARVYAPSTAIDNWTVTQGSVDWIGAYWQAQQGSRSLDLDGDEGVPGAISQTFDTNVGSSYFVSFYMSGNPDQGPTLKTMTVSATGGSTTAYTYDTSAAGTTLANMQWAVKGYTFTATSVATTLTFTSTTPGGYGPALDNVVITETRPAGAQCKGGGWMAMTDRFGTPFKNQGDCVSYFATGEKNLAAGD